MLAKLSFEVVESPVKYTTGDLMLDCNSHKVLSRSDDNRVLSVMKNSYIPTLNKDFMESTERMMEISGFKFEGYSEFDNGRVIFSHLKNTDGGVQIGGHKIDDYLLMGSSFDGRFPFFIGTTTYMIRCKNQFSKISKIESIRHTKSAPRRIDELMRSLEIYFNERKQMYVNFEKMNQYEIDPDIRKRAMDFILEISQEDRLAETISTRKLNQFDTLDIAINGEIADLGNTLFGLFQGATKYTTHFLTQKERTFGNVLGNAAKINNRAYQFATELIY